MTNQLVPVIQAKPVRIEEIGGYEDEIFSPYTHPVLEKFIQRVIDENRDALRTVESRELVREFLLYGFLKATGYEMVDNMTSHRHTVGTADQRSLFHTNNGVIALYDFDGKIYLRGGDSHQGYNSEAHEPPKEGIEGTLLALGYEQDWITVPHSTDTYIFLDKSIEKLFQLLLFFSREVKDLRGEPENSIICRNLKDKKPSAPYPRRNPDLPRIGLQDIILIPGNRENTILLYK